MAKKTVERIAPFPFRYGCQREDKSIPILGMKSIPPLPDSVLRIDPVLRDFSP